MTLEQHRLAVVLLETIELSALIVAVIALVLAFRKMCLLWQTTNDVLRDVRSRLTDIDTGIDCLNPSDRRT